MSEVIEVKAEELAAIMEQSTVRAERILRLEDELAKLRGGCLRSAEPVSDDELVGSLEDCVGWLDWLYHPDHDDKFKSQLARIKRAKEALAAYRAAQEKPHD